MCSAWCSSAKAPTTEARARRCPSQIHRKTEICKTGVIEGSGHTAIHAVQLPGTVSGVVAALFALVARACSRFLKVLSGGGARV